MGFLDGLVNDMLKESTGYDVRKISRMVGGKNLLMLGAGAALAGGLAGGFGQEQNDGPSTWAAPPGPGGASGRPPLPPTPGSAGPPTVPGVPAAGVPAAGVPAADLPPLPPTPASQPSELPAVPEPPPTETVAGLADIPDEPSPGPEEAVVSPELTYAIVRTMVAAALADGNMEEQEKSVILDRLDASGLDAQRVQQVHRDLVIPPSPAELAAMTDAFHEREAMYRFAGLILLSDGNVSDLERGWLDRLAVAFGFDADRKGALEAEIFAE